MTETTARVGAGRLALQHAQAGDPVTVAGREIARQ
jgi:hypothetical protein